MKELDYDKIKAAAAADIDAIVEACEAGDYSMWDSSKVSYRSPLK